MAYSHVQGATNSTGTNTSTLTTTPTSSITATNGVMATVHYATSTGSAIAISGFKDQSGNALSYVEAGTGVFSASTEFGSHLVYIPNFGAGVTGIVVTMASTCNLGISLTVDEYSGLTSSAAFAGSPGYASTNTTATGAANNVSSGTATPTGQPAMVYGVATDDSRSNHAPTVGTTLAFTSRVTVNHPNTGDAAGLTEDVRITSLSAVAATFTNTGTSGDTFSTLMGIVAEAGGGGGVNPLFFTTPLEGGFSEGF